MGQIGMPNAISDTVARAFQEEGGRVLASLIAYLGDFELAEDALQDAMIIALEQWQTEGIPKNPAAWMTTIAKRKAVDRVRRQQTLAKKHTLLLTELDTAAPFAAPDEYDDMTTIPDERLKLMFTCCHPAIAKEAQIALTLQTLGRLSVAEIARAFLTTENTMAQRLSRAKQKIQAAGIPYEVPPLERLPERLDSLLAVIYLIFNEGYCATEGDALIRGELCQEAIRLMRVLVGLLPPVPLRSEAEGLLALMLLHDSRRQARTDSLGNLIVLSEQDRTQWNASQITEGIALLDNALAYKHVGAYQIQAAISALHAQAHTPHATDWAQIVALYRVLHSVQPSAVVEVNWAVAVGMAEGASEGLHILERLGQALQHYYPYHVARASLLRLTDRCIEAKEAYALALNLCQNQQERTHLQHQHDGLAC